MGYDRATIRAIAAEAGVDKSSVVKYFGSKEQLFDEAVEWRTDLEGLHTENAATTADNYVRAVLVDWAADPDSPMSVLLRASLTSEQAAERLRQHITAEYVDGIARRFASIPESEARLRAALISALLFGIAAQRYLLRLPDIAGASVEDVVRLSAPLVRSLLETDCGD